MTASYPMALAALLLVGFAERAHAVILPPTDDSSGTLIYSGRPPVVTMQTLTSLNGASTALPVSRTRTAFIRFAVEEAGNMGSTVEQARLTLYFPSVTRPGDLRLHLVTEDWEETFSGPTRTHPTIGAGFLTIPAASVIKKQFVIVELTQQVRDWLAHPGSNFGIAVTSPDGVVVATLGSKEGSASGYPPLLEIEGTGATSESTPDTIVKRDADGNFMVGTITGALLGNATSATTAETATHFTGVLAGDVTGMQGATVVSNGAITSSKIAAGAVGNSHLANPGLTVTAGTGLSGGGVVDLGGGITLANAGVLSLTGGGGITVSANVGAITLGSSATPLNTAGALVARDANGDFAAGRVTAGSFVGDGSGLTGVAPRVDRQFGHRPGNAPSIRSTTYEDLVTLTTKNLGEPGCYVISVSTGFLNGSSNSQGTFAVLVNEAELATQNWFVTSLDDVSFTVVANNVPPGSVIKFVVKVANINSSILVSDPRMMIDGVPQSYVIP